MGLFSVFDFSKQNITSTQTNNLHLIQQLSGGCNVTNNTTIKDVTIVLDQTFLKGGIHFKQTLNMNTSCIINAAMQNIASQIIKTQTTNKSAGSPGGKLAGLYGVSLQKISTKNEINTAISQKIKEHCGVQVSELEENINIIAEKSTINGRLAWNQNDTSNSNCALKLLVSSISKAEGYTQDYNKVLGGNLIKLLFFLIIISAIIGTIILITKKSKHKKKKKFN